MGRGSFWVALGVAALALGGGAYHYLAEKGAPAGRIANAATPTADSVVAVEAKRVTTDAVIEDIRAVGTLQPNEAVIVSPEIAGRIHRLRFAEGQEVAAGDVLVELDATILRAELAKIQSDLTLAEANRERAMTLARRGAGTLRARDEAIAAHQAAEANLALAQARLEKASIAAPFSGIVGLRAVSAGAYVTPGDRLVGLADIDPIKVDFRVPELVLSSLRAGQVIRVTVDAVPGRTFEGKVYAIDPTVDVNGRAVRLRARIANPDRLLFPGLFARVQIVVEQRENSVLVPESAVFSRGQERLVYRVVEGRAVLTKIELGQRRPGQVEVIDGLGHDAVVVTAGHQQLRDGARVEIVNTRAGL
ncbi:MAG: efflux RND transporter periplasmic adaptor subunit [Rhodospirillales bacterium]|nr:efflux RND transporter periplasmic adaptor subunit [Rhodospirillales bacterium]